MEGVYEPKVSKDTHVAFSTEESFTKSMMPPTIESSMGRSRQGLVPILPEAYTSSTFISKFTQQQPHRHSAQLIRQSSSALGRAIQSKTVHNGTTFRNKHKRFQSDYKTTDAMKVAGGILSEPFGCVESALNILHSDRISTSGSISHRPLHHPDKV